MPKYGCIKDVVDDRDFKFSATGLESKTATLVDLRPLMPPVYDQGQLGSCTANAIAAAFEFDQMKQKLPHVWRPARLYIYYNERVIEGTVSTDSGAQIRDGIKSVNTQGCCSEDLWNYNIAEFATKPPPACYTEGATHLCTSYESVAQDLNEIKTALASGFPVIIGFTVYTAFESQEVASTGVLNMPAANESVLGGHAVLVVGYDDSQQRFIVRNSWGPNWGMAGYFTMPYAYLTNPDLASDFWALNTVEGTATA